VCVCVCVCAEDKRIEAAEENSKCDGDKAVPGNECGTTGNTGTGSGTAEHLALGSQFTFCINVLQATGISSDYCDVYCQFRYSGRRRRPCLNSSLHCVSETTLMCHAITSTHFNRF